MYSNNEKLAYIKTFITHKIHEFSWGVIFGLYHKHSFIIQAPVKKKSQCNNNECQF